MLSYPASLTASAVIASATAALSSLITVVVIKDGKITATVVWSSPNYDYMLVDGTKYLNENKGGNSTFTIPVSGFDCDIAVVGDTVAMSTPHEIEYTLNFKLVK